MEKQHAKVCFLALVVPLIALNLSAQAPSIQWTKTYGGIYPEEGYSVQETSDGGYVIVGCTGSFGAGRLDVYLVRTQANGELLWTRTYGGVHHDAGLSVQETFDGGYIIAGKTMSFGAGGCDVYLVRTDANGDTLWTKTYGGVSYDEGNSVEETSDLGYIIAGVTHSFGSGNGDMYLIKTDVNGNVFWTKTYGGSGYDEGNSVQQTFDGGYIAAGYTVSFGSNVYLVRTDPNGDSLWSKTYGGASSDCAHSVEQTSDSGFAIVGETFSFGAGYQDVYLIRTDADGEALWTKTYGGDASDRGSSIQETHDGKFIIAGATSSFGAGGWDTYLLKVRPASDTAGASHQSSPCVATDDSGNFVVAWGDERNGNSDICCQRYDSFGIAIGQNFVVNDDTGSSPQGSPCVAMKGSGEFVIAWEDRRNGQGDIYCQRYDSSGLAQGGNLKVNDEAVGGSNDPSAAMGRSGQFVITWWGGPNGNDVYCQRYSSSGEAQGPNFRVNDLLEEDRGYPSVGMDEFGNFAIAWEDSRNQDYDIYCQRYDSSGLAQGGNFKVNDDVGPASQYYPSLGMNESGESVIAFMDSRAFRYDIYCQRYSSSGVPEGVNRKVTDRERYWQSYPSAARGRLGNFVIVWEADSYNIYCQRYSASGAAAGTNFRVNDGEPFSHRHRACADMDGLGDFVVAWEDYRNGNQDIYCQRVAASGILQGKNFRVNDDQGWPGDTLWTKTHGGVSDEQGHSVHQTSDGGYIVAGYTCSFGLGSADIYLMKIGSETSVEEEAYSQERNVVLQSRPNPLTDRTTIRYTLPRATDVRIVVYNLLGQEIKTLLNAHQDAGLHALSWNGTDNSDRSVSSGSYFLRLDAGQYTATRKVCVVR